MSLKFVEDFPSTKNLAASLTISTPQHQIYFENVWIVNKTASGI